MTREWRPRRARAGVRARLVGERGTSLVDTIVASALLALLVPIAMPVVIGMFNAVLATEATSRSLDELRIAQATISRELRSAECVGTPGPNASGDELTFTTHAHGSPLEVTYRRDGSELVREADSATRTVATGLVAGDPVFLHRSTPRRSLDLVFSVRIAPDRPVEQVRTVVAARNGWRDCT